VAVDRPNSAAAVCSAARLASRGNWFSADDARLDRLCKFTAEAHQRQAFIKVGSHADGKAPPRACSAWLGYGSKRTAPASIGNGIALRVVLKPLPDWRSLQQLERAWTDRVSKNPYMNKGNLDMTTALPSPGSFDFQMELRSLADRT